MKIRSRWNSTLDLIVGFDINSNEPSRCHIVIYFIKENLLHNEEQQLAIVGTMQISSSENIIHP
jgi:hypothetical protein